jgi:ABC-2 type transport system permease protein
VVVIPHDFDARVAQDDAVVGLTLNNMDSDFADDIRRTVDRSVAEFDAPQLGFLGERNGPSQGLVLPNVYRVAVAQHDLRQTTVDYLHYNLVPVLVLVVINVGMLGTALLAVHDIERGTGEAMLLARVSRAALVVGRMLGGAAATLAVLLPVLAVAAALGLLRPDPMRWPAIAAVFVVTTVVAVALGLVLAVTLRQARVVSMGAVTVATYLFLLGGGFTTVVYLPQCIQAVSHAVPTSYAIAGLRQVLFYSDLTGFAQDLAALGISTAVALGLGTLAMNRAWRRAR